MKDAGTVEQLNLTRELTTLISDIYVEFALQQDWFMSGEMNLNDLKERSEKLNVLVAHHEQAQGALKHLLRLNHKLIPSTSRP